MNYRTTNNPRGNQPVSGAAHRSNPRSEANDELQQLLAKIRLGPNPEPELFAETAEQAAQYIAENSRGENNRGTQLRRFYDEILRWNEIVNGTLEGRDERYQKYQPLIRMLIAKVAYAKGRKHVDANYEKMLRYIVAQIKDPETLEQAKLFLEAFSGFYKVYGNN